MSHNDCWYCLLYKYCSDKINKIITGWQSPLATAEMEVSSILVVNLWMGKSDLSLTLVLTVTPHATAARNRNVRGPGQDWFYVQNLKESRLQYMLWERLWHLHFLNEPVVQGGCLAQIDTAGRWWQSCCCKMDSHWCGLWHTPPTVTEMVHGSPATRLYEPIVTDLPLHNFHQHKSACVHRSNLVGRVLVLPKFHGQLAPYYFPKWSYLYTFRKYPLLLKKFPVSF